MSTSGKVNLTSTSFSDIDFNFGILPGSNDIAKKLNANSINQSIRNILLTSNYEIGFDPDFGSQINQLLFSLWTPLTKQNFVTVIQNAINNYEPRVLINEIILNNNTTRNAVDVTINYTIRNVNIPATISVTLERVR